MYGSESVRAIGLPIYGVLESMRVMVVRGCKWLIRSFAACLVFLLLLENGASEIDGS
jgi:hypothetical protein